MGEFDTATEGTIRLACFIGVLAIMSISEVFLPRRPLVARKSWRWASNLILVAINIGLVRVLIPVTAVAAAMTGEDRGWGGLHLVEWPAWLEFVLAVAAFDFAIYLQHVLFHAVPLLWRVHRVHHADLDLDVTTGVRFHTLEILLSALIKIGAVMVIGPSPVAVIAFEVLLNASSLFNHSNVDLPSRLDRMLRWLIVTPDMHRVHHSVLPNETNSNFGFNLPWWDYLLGTYLPQPREGHLQMTIGLMEVREERVADRLDQMLLLPFCRLSAPEETEFGPKGKPPRVG
ncbi:MAG: sterol desaturase family protein [Planctomycetaceae bacterium]|nr:sterol desaturase family protein [Planctomycetaceae bacterium]